MQKTYQHVAKEKIDIRPGFEHMLDSAIDKVLEFYQNATGVLADE